MRAPVSGLLPMDPLEPCVFVWPRGGVGVGMGAWVRPVLWIHPVKQMPCKVVQLYMPEKAKCTQAVSVSFQMQSPSEKI